MRTGSQQCDSGSFFCYTSALLRIAQHDAVHDIAGKAEGGMRVEVREELRLDVIIDWVNERHVVMAAIVFDELDVLIGQSTRVVVNNCGECPRWNLLDKFILVKDGRYSYPSPLTIVIFNILKRNRRTNAKFIARVLLRSR
jgi:hypothetical protein